MPSPEQLRVRLQELAAMRSGWLDGQGKGFDPSELRVLGDFLSDAIYAHLPPPHLYPTEEGQVQAEWERGGWTILATFTIARTSDAAPAAPQEGTDAP